ncbi:Ionotropic receptor 679 [Blattella germanica]|nr:Ionotropic receptor 679 [Blattella germanica]
MDLDFSVILLMVISPISSLVLLPTEEKHFITCLKRISEQYFTDLSKFVISLPFLEDSRSSERSLSTSNTKSTTMNMAELLSRELNSMSKTIVIIQSNEKNVESVLTGSNLMYTQHVLIVFFPSKIISAVLSTKSDFVVILIFTSHYYELENEIVPAFFKTFATGKIFNLLLIIPKMISQESNMVEIKSLTIYTWYPYDPIQNCGKFKKAVKVNEWVLEDGGKFTGATPLFPQVVSTDFNGCELVSRRIIPNTDYTVGIHYLVEIFELEHVKISAEVLNMKLTVIEEAQKGIIPDVLLGALTLNSLPKFAYEGGLQPYRATQLKWFVPCPVSILRHGNFIRVFSLHIWIILLIITVLTASVIHLLYIATNDSKLRHSFSSTLLKVWGVLTGVSIDLGPANLKFRIMLITWVSYCLLISTVFQAFFTGFLIEPGFYVRISNIVQLNNSDLIRGIPLEDYVPLNDVIRESGIFSITNVTCSFVECLFQYLAGNDFAMFSDVSDMDFFCDYMGYHCCMIDDMSITVYYSFLITRNSYFFDAISTIVLRIVESGIMSKIERDIIERPTIKESVLVTGSLDELVHDSSEDYFIFALHHLKVAFYFLGMGSFISLIIFLFERFISVIYFKIFFSKLLK